MILIEEKNKYEFDDLFNCVIETEDKFLNKKLNSNICFGKGGGGGQKQQDIAPTLRPFVTDVLERAKAEFTQEELAPYLGERVVGFSDDELAAQEGILGLVDRGISSDKRLSSADTYYDPALGLLRKSGRYTDKGASEITADEIQSRMNPYTQAVLDIAKRKAADEAQLYGQQLSAQAARTGGFGGSRQAILEAKAASDLGSRLSEIQTKGLEAAYNDAIRAAEAQRGRQFQAASGLGALSGQFGNLGQQALGQAYREQGYRSGVGEAQRGLEQQRADIGYQTFVEQRDFPARQLERYAGIAFGVPQGYLQQPGPAMPSAFQQFAGGAATVGGLGRGLGFFKEGGDVGKGGLSTVYKKAGSSVLEDLSLQEAYLRYLELAGQREPFDKEKEEKRIKEDKGFAIAQLGANILAADPSRGALAAIGQAAPSAIQQLSALEKERTGLDEAARKAEMEELLLEAGIIEKLREASEIGTVDVSGLTGLSDTEFENVDSAVSKLQSPAVKTFLDKQPRQRLSLRQQANRLALADANAGIVTNQVEFDDAIRKYYADLLTDEKTLSQKILEEEENNPKGQQLTPAEIARRRKEKSRKGGTSN